MQPNPSNGSKGLVAPSGSGRHGSAGYRIVFIDDNPQVLEPITTALCFEGHNVRSTTHGNELSHLVDILDPDILITDIMMDEIDVLDAITQLRESRPHLKIIAISANPHLLTLASRNGATHILTKPFPLERLNLLIKVTMQ